ncbi:ParB/RepB/Spo0J family partition protein [Egicoccus sp. AB-alg6-2]|uniref:ParB/RepB/Spo0J family partition protein n=1 Tax=Egicoccus sp. AB-alg6-2 TaxID=3242692 RepID=UPI00359E5C2B
MSRRGGLGRGLAALIPPGEGDAESRATLAELALDHIVPNPRQPRDVFDEDELAGLATSIADMGVLQPLVVRPRSDGRYELVAGERRLRASRLAGLERVPAVVRHTEDADLLKEALVENIHRVQLNPLEEAAAYQQLLEDFGFTQEELAERLGRSRPAVSNALRLLTLPAQVQRRVAAGVLSAGHAKALLSIDDPTEMARVADRVVAEGLSVRATEELVRLRFLDEDVESRDTRRRSRRVVAPGLVELQDDLSDALRTRVKISMGPRSGRLQIEFGSVDDLERVVAVIARGLEGDGSGLPATAAAVTKAQSARGDAELDAVLDRIDDVDTEPAERAPGDA